MSWWRTLELLLLLVELLRDYGGRATGVGGGSRAIEDFENFFNGIDVEDEDADTKNRNALRNPRQRWPSTTLLYKISSDYTPTEATNVHNALRVLDEKTCLHFKEYDEQRDGKRPYVHYKRSANVCGTRVGYGAVPHDVMLNPYCLSHVGVIQHETLHVLGLYHEQSRPDRNKHIRIEYSNIPQKYWPQFAAYSDLLTTTFDLPYDYESLMHYSENAFAKDPSKPSMRARVGDTIVDRKMGQIDGPSEGDLAKINLMYKCS